MNMMMTSMKSFYIRRLKATQSRNYKLILRRTRPTTYVGMSVRWARGETPLPNVTPTNHPTSLNIGLRVIIELALEGRSQNLCTIGDISVHVIQESR